MSTITLKNGALEVKTPYNQDFVQAIKTLPASDRKFEPNTKAWLVDPRHGSMVASWIAQYMGELVMLPQTASVKQVDDTDIFEIKYIGTTKDRGGSTRSAMGYCKGEWSVVFDEDVLRAWFDQAPTPINESNLYSILSTNQQATPEQIKSAYRRMARQWHPDVCREPNAAEQFRCIQHAYEILSNDLRRAKYDAGLKLQAHTAAPHDRVQSYSNDQGYRSPLRCGLMLLQGHYVLGRFAVTKILQWEDIVNSRGQTLVTSWRAGADMFSEAWV